MKRTFGYHPRFASYTVAPRLLAENANIIRLRIDAAQWHPAPLRLMSFLVRDDDGFVPFACIEVYDEAILVPQAYADCETVLRTVCGQLEPWIDANPTGTPAQSLAPDAVLDAIDVAHVAIPGASPHATLTDAVDRYRAVASLAAGRTTALFAPGIGYGSHMLGAVAETLAIVPLEPELARAFGVTLPETMRFPVECAIAVGIGRELVAPVLTTMRTAVAETGTTVVTTRGAGGDDALARLDLTSRPLKRLAMDALPPFDDEFIGVIASPVAVRAPDAPHAPAVVDPRPLRVLFVLRSSAETVFGGDVVQVRRTAESLRARGHRVDITTDRVPVVASDLDIVHLTNLTVPPDTLAQAQAVEGFAGPVVMMPIFTDHADETAWGMQVWPQVFTVAREASQLTELLRMLALRRINANLPHHGGAIAPPARIDMIAGYTDMQRAIVERCDYFVANAHAEMHRVYRHLDVSVPYAVAPSAADPKIYAPETAAAFRMRYALGDFVVTTGRIEERKNQLMLAWAMRGQNRRLVMVGKNYTPAQAHLLHAYLDPRVILFGEMPEQELAGLMAAARVVALPSWDEVVSLSSLNAAASGTSIVLTRNSYEHEYLRDDAEYCDPADVDSIAAAVDRAWTTHDARAERRRALSERVRREYTWDVAAAMTENAYHRVLASNPRGEARRARFATARSA